MPRKQLYQNPTRRTFLLDGDVVDRLIANSKEKNVSASRMLNAILTAYYTKADPVTDNLVLCK